MSGLPYTYRTDLWSLGVVLLELFSDRAIMIDARNPVLSERALQTGLQVIEPPLDKSLVASLLVIEVGAQRAARDLLT